MDNLEKNPVDVNFKSGSERIVGSEMEFSWRDVEFIISEGIALRHVSAEEVARDNAKNGFNGDAVALFNIGETFLNENKSELINGNEDIKRMSESAKSYGMDLEINQIKDYLDAESKEKIIALMHEKVMKFVKDSLDIGLSGLIDRNASVDEMRDVLKTRSSFLLVKLGKQTPYVYDQDRYYGLGKIGKQDVKADGVVGKVYASEVVGSLGLSGAVVDQVVTDDFFNGVGKNYYRNIVQSVKDLTVMESI